MDQEILFGSLKKIEPGKAVLCLTDGALLCDINFAKGVDIIITMLNGINSEIPLTEWPLVNNAPAYVHIKESDIALENELGIEDGSLYITLDEKINDSLVQNQRQGFVVHLANSNNVWKVQVEGEDLMASFAAFKRSSKEEKAQEKAPEENLDKSLFSGVADPNFQYKEPNKTPYFKILALIAGILVLLGAIFFVYKLFTSYLDHNDEAKESVTETQSVENNNSNDLTNKPLEGAFDDSGSHINAKDANASILTPSISNTQNVVVSSCALTEKSDGEIIKNCLASKPDMKTLSTLSQDALEQGRCDLAKRIMASFGRSGNVDMALNYAKYADPNDSLHNDCIKKDKKTAVYWYQKVLEQGDNKIATSALERLK